MERCLYKIIQKRSIPFNRKENLANNINLSGPPENDSKYTINYVFNLHDPLDTIHPSKIEIENSFLPTTEKKHSNYYRNIKNLIQLLDN